MMIFENEQKCKVLQKELEDLSFIQNLVKDTRTLIAISGQPKHEFPWKEYITGVAKEFNTGERRIRRILRKAGLYTP
jgi:hypothetical protein